jgi:hypothetical protein
VQHPGIQSRRDGREGKRKVHVLMIQLLLA